MIETYRTKVLDSQKLRSGVKDVPFIIPESTMAQSLRIQRKKGTHKYTSLEKQAKINNKIVQEELLRQYGIK